MWCIVLAVYTTMYGYVYDYVFVCMECVGTGNWFGESRVVWHVT